MYLHGNENNTGQRKSCKNLNSDNLAFFNVNLQEGFGITGPVGIGIKLDPVGINEISADLI